MKTLSWMLGLSLALSNLAFADQLRVGMPQSGGTGCPAGTAQVFFSPERGEIELAFDDFTTQVDSPRQLDRKACNVAIPIQVPAGYRIALNGYQVEGTNLLSRRSSTTVSVENFFAGSRGETVSKTFQGSGPFALEGSGQVSTGWSACGDDVILRSRISMATQSGGSRQWGGSRIESLRVGGGGMRYLLKVRRCD